MLTKAERRAAVKAAVDGALPAIAAYFQAEAAIDKAKGERPEGCSKGCTGRMCRDALNCDAKGRSRGS